MSGGYVYFVSGHHYAYTGYFKVGVSKHYKKRIAQIQTYSPFYILPVCVVTHSIPEELEQKVLREFKESAIRGEWFCVVGRNIQEESKGLAKLVTDFMITNCDGEAVVGGR